MTEPHVLQPPPQDDEINQKVAEILLATASLYLAAQLIEKLLRPWKVSLSAILPVLKLVRRGTAHRPRPKFKAEGVDRSAPSADLVRTMANEDLFYRAAFVVNASKRVQARLNSGATPLAGESMNYAKHEYARTQRAKAARRTALAAQLYGNTLGWHLNPNLNNEIECITASGNNFRVGTVPKIGLPGAVHVGCGCYAGAPHVAGGWVDDAIDSLKRSGKLQIRRKAG